MAARLAASAALLFSGLHPHHVHRPTGPALELAWRDANRPWSIMHAFNYALTESQTNRGRSTAQRCRKLAYRQPPLVALIHYYEHLASFNSKYQLNFDSHFTFINNLLEHFPIM